MSEMRSHVCFAGLVLLGTAVYFFPIGALVKLVFENETYSHISLIPLVSLFLLVIQRKSIFAEAGRKPAAGFAVCAGGLALYGLATVLREHLGRPDFRNQDVPNDYLTLCMAGWVAWVIGSFIAVYGTQAFKKARFALFFLVFAIPIPVFLLERIVTVLQHASAEAADIVFRLTGAPYHRSRPGFRISQRHHTGGRGMQRYPFEPVAFHPEHHHGLPVPAHIFPAGRAGARHLPHHGGQERFPDRYDHAFGQLRRPALYHQPLDPQERGHTVLCRCDGDVHSAGVGPEKNRRPRRTACSAGFRAGGRGRQRPDQLLVQNRYGLQLRAIHNKNNIEGFVNSGLWHAAPSL